MSPSLRAAAAIAAHDVAAELRRPIALAGVLLFSAGSIVALHLALAGGSRPAPPVAAGALWIVLIYAAMLAVSRTLATEREAGTWDALLLAPCDRTAIFAGKAVATATLGLVLHAIVLPLYLIAFAAPPDARGLATLVLVVALADVGFAAVGTMVGAISLRARGRELLSGAMFIPLALPLVIAATTASIDAFGGAAAAGPMGPLAFLAAYDAIFVVLGIGLFAELAVD